MKVITSWATLMYYAKQLGKARLTGNKEEIKKWQTLHDNYRDICLEADEMII